MGKRAELLSDMVALGVITPHYAMTKKSLRTINQFPTVIECLLSVTSFIQGTLKDTLRERIYCVKRSISHVPKCIVCGGQVKFRPDGVNVGYPDTCSRQCSYSSSNRQTKRIATSIQKYGVRLPQQSEEVKLRTEQTNLKKYGAQHVNQRSIEATSIDCLLSVTWLTHHHHVLQKTLSQIADELSVDVSTVQRHAHKLGITTKHFYVSSHEREVREFVESLGLQVECNSRTLISPYEIDIVCHSHKVAIEYCGLYWHSEQQGKHKNYHKNKMDACERVGYRLITIYSDEWEQRRDIVKRKLMHVFGCSTEPRIFARQCTVGVVQRNECKAFLTANHLQGDGPGSIRLGLYFNDTLVAIMLFTQGKERQYTLTRYATCMQVVGGFSKLLTHFKRSVDWNQIVSFADKRWSDGNMYIVTGWTKNRMLLPDYYYSPDGHIRIHKFNYRRKRLPNRLVNFDPTLSETQNCRNNKILRIWDCGKIRFTLNNTKKG